VTLPEGVVAGDLDNQSLWRKTQGRPDLSLQVFDRLELRAFDRPASQQGGLQISSTG
jgi:hypothetical protein